MQDGTPVIVNSGGLCSGSVCGSPVYIERADSRDATGSPGNRGVTVAVGGHAMARTRKECPAAIWPQETRQESPKNAEEEREASFPEGDLPCYFHSGKGMQSSPSGLGCGKG